MLFNLAKNISIHALLAESDIADAFVTGKLFLFLSTLSLRRATRTGLLFRWIAIFLSTLSLRRATGSERILWPVMRNFYPRSPCGERLCWTLIFAGGKLFLSTLSLRRATPPGTAWMKSGRISIHALLAESDVSSRSVPSSCRHFYPRSPCGERPTNNANYGGVTVFLSTLSLRRATQVRKVWLGGWAISIHALLAESDGIRKTRLCQLQDFYPRSPCGERHVDGVISYRKINFYPRSPCGERLPRCSNRRIPRTFLSTLSLRRATVNTSFALSALGDFYPRSPCGERPNTVGRIYLHSPISIHALLAESDGILSIHIIGFSGFLSTLSLRRATRTPAKPFSTSDISIHALLAESDLDAPESSRYFAYFYPRSPCGERRFCPTLEGHKTQISIHALLAESDNDSRDT